MVCILYRSIFPASGPLLRSIDWNMERLSVKIIKNFILKSQDLQYISGRNQMSRHIIKSNGNIEDFDSEKIINSLIRSGCSRKQSESAFEYIKGGIHDGMSTDDIYQMALKHLSKVEHKLALKYSLKKAMMGMGPHGYIFEQYISKILSKYGYHTEVSQILKGRCVDHEVDVVAKKDNLVFFIECKYHNHRGTYSDVKTALYIHARFVDIEKAIIKKPDEKTHYYGWLVTNTKCTGDAVKYASCVKLKILAWQYPETKNLQYYIEKKKLYPVSILTSINKKQKEVLFDSGILLVQELIAMDAEGIMSILSIDRSATLKILNEIDLLLS